MIQPQIKCVRLEFGWRSVDGSLQPLLVMLQYQSLEINHMKKTNSESSLRRWAKTKLIDLKPQVLHKLADNEMWK